MHKQVYLGMLTLLSSLAMSRAGFKRYGSYGITNSECAVLLEPMSGCAAALDKLEPMADNCCTMTSIFVRAGCFCTNCRDMNGQLDLGLQTVVMQNLGLDSLTQACWIEDHMIYSSTPEDVFVDAMIAVNANGAASTDAEQLPPSIMAFNEGDMMAFSEARPELLDNIQGDVTQQAGWSGVMESLNRVYDFFSVPFQASGRNADADDEVTSQWRSFAQLQQQKVSELIQQVADIPAQMAQLLPLTAGMGVADAGSVAQWTDEESEVVARRYLETVREQVLRQTAMQPEHADPSDLHAESATLQFGEQPLPGEVLRASADVQLDGLAYDSDSSDQLQDQNDVNRDTWAAGQTLEAGSLSLDAAALSASQQMAVDFTHSEQLVTEETAMRAAAWNALQAEAAAQRASTQQEVAAAVAASITNQGAVIQRVDTAMDKPSGFEAKNDDYAWDVMEAPSLVSNNHMSQALAWPAEVWDSETDMWTWLNGPWEERTVALADPVVANNMHYAHDLDAAEMAMSRRLGASWSPESLRSQAAEFVHEHYWTLLIALSTFNLVGFAIMLARLYYLERVNRQLQEAQEEEIVVVTNPLVSKQELEAFITDVTSTFSSQAVREIVDDKRLPLLANEVGSQ